jgi:hypothetical protein
MFILQSGTGNGKSAGITDKNQLLTRSVVSGSLFEAAEVGDAYIIPTDFVSLTAGTTGLLYWKVHPEMTHLNHITVASDVVAKVRLWRDVTAGTLITAGTAVSPVNMNSGSGNEFDGDALQGADGQTVTDGVLTHTALCPANATVHLPFDDAFLMGANATFAVTIEVAGAGTVSANVVLYHHEAHGGGH